MVLFLLCTLLTNEKRVMRVLLANKRLVLPVVALVKLGFESCAVGLGALLLDGGGGVNKILSKKKINISTIVHVKVKIGKYYLLLLFFLFLLGLDAQVAGEEAGELLKHLGGHL